MKAPEERFFILREPHVDWFWTGWGFSTQKEDAILVSEEVLSCLLGYYSQSEFHPMYIVTAREI